MHMRQEHVLEQCSLTGGRCSSLAMSEFLIVAASFSCFPMIHSVASDELAIAEPQPNVLNLASMILPSVSTCMPHKRTRNE